MAMTIDFKQVLSVSIDEPTQWSAWLTTQVRIFMSSGMTTLAMPHLSILVCNEQSA